MHVFQDQSHRYSQSTFTVSWAAVRLDKTPNIDPQNWIVKHTKRKEKKN